MRIENKVSKTIVFSQWKSIRIRDRFQKRIIIKDSIISMFACQTKNTRRLPSAPVYSQNLCCLEYTICWWYHSLNCELMLENLATIIKGIWVCPKLFYLT